MHWNNIFIPENVDARQDTTAEDIFSRCSKDILNPILTNTNSSGSSGAPSQPAQLKKFTKMLVQHAYIALLFIQEKIEKCQEKIKSYH